MALIKRKLVTHLDEKYLILMAEKRGLFGDTGPKKGRMRPQTKTIKKEEKPKPPKVTKRRKSDDMNLLVERISHPTHASVKRSHSKRKSSAEFKMLIYDPLNDECESCIRHESRYVSRNIIYVRNATPYKKSVYSISYLLIHHSHERGNGGSIHQSI